MPDQQESAVDLPVGDLHEITLRIPGECFFCETINLPDEPPAETEVKKSQSISQWDGYLSSVLSNPNFSPYPLEQLAWGYHLCSKQSKAFIFASPLSRLRQLGWQNLELFRRVFPSFIGLLGKEYSKPTALFLLSEETLTLACFETECSVPESLHSLRFDPDEEEGLESARAKLLSLADLAKYHLVKDVLVAGEVFRDPNDFFLFDHQWMEGKDPELELDQDVRMSADDLWQHDLRSTEFKVSEKNRRRQRRSRWKAIKMSALVAVLMAICFVGLEIGESQLTALSSIEQQKARQVPLVIESKKLLEKLKQNKLGGIDPFGTIVRIANFRGGPPERPHIWFSHAHFEARNLVKIEGEGKNVESVNTFIEQLEKNEVATLRTGRSGEERREIKSGGGSTTFEVDFRIIEETKDASGIVPGNSLPPVDAP